MTSGRQACLAKHFENKSTNQNIKTNKTHSFREKSQIVCKLSVACLGPSGPLSGSFKCYSKKCISSSTAYIGKLLLHRKGKGHPITRHCRHILEAEV